MGRARSVVDARVASIGYMPTELDVNGVSMDLRKRAEALHGAGVVPEPAPVRADRDEWRRWIEAAAPLVAQKEADAMACVCAREAACTHELGAATAAAEAARSALSEAQGLVGEWLALEGQLRLLSTMIAPSRLRLKRILYSKRSEVFRRMCATSVDAKLVFRAARRELDLVTEAKRVAVEIEAAPVQERKYSPATLRCVVLDGRESPAAQLVGNEEKQADLCSALALYLGEAREERIVVAGAARVSLPVQYSDKVVNEPGTEIVLEIAREEEGERASTLVLGQLVSAHEDGGHFADMMGVSRDKVRVCVPTPPREDVRDNPSLVDMRESSLELQRVCQERLDRANAEKAFHKANLRTWHRLKGALANVRRLDTAAVLATAAEGGGGATADAATTEEGAALEAAGEAAGGAAAGSAAADIGTRSRRMSQAVHRRALEPSQEGLGADAVTAVETESEPATRFLARWLGVRDILRTRLAVLRALAEKELRLEMRTEVRGLAGSHEMRPAWRLDHSSVGTLPFGILPPRARCGQTTHPPLATGPPVLAARGQCTRQLAHTHTRTHARTRAHAYPHACGPTPTCPARVATAGQGRGAAALDRHAAAELRRAAGAPDLGEREARHRRRQVELRAASAAVGRAADNQRPPELFGGLDGQLRPRRGGSIEPARRQGEQASVLRGGSAGAGRGGDGGGGAR